MTTWRQLYTSLERCRLCSRWLVRETDSPFFGAGNLKARVMFVGESPGNQPRVKNGLVFSGNKTGDFFMECLVAAGFTFGNCYLTNVIKCQRSNETPNELEIHECVAYLKQEIELVKPEVIVALGHIADGAVSYAAKDRPSVKLAKLRHPSYVLRFNKNGTDVYIKELFKIWDYLR